MDIATHCDGAFLARDMLAGNERSGSSSSSSSGTSIVGCSSNNSSSSNITKAGAVMEFRGMTYDGLNIRFVL